MEEAPTYKYDQLDTAPELSELAAFNLVLSNKQAAALQKAEKRIHNYQMLEALNQNRQQTIFAAVRVLVGELKGMLLNPKLNEVRGLMLSGRVKTTKHTSISSEAVRIAINLTKAKS